MIDQLRKLGCALMCTVVLFGVSGCEDDNGGSEAGAAPSVDVTGTWVATTSVGESATLTMTQSGGDVTGTFFSSFGSEGTLSGSVSGNTVLLTLNETNFDRIVTEVTGTVEGNTMRGTLSQSDGASASFTATKR